MIYFLLFGFLWVYIFWLLCHFHKQSEDAKRQILIRDRLHKISREEVRRAS